VVKDQRAAGALMVGDRAEAGEVDHNQFDSGCLFEGPGNHWDVVTTR
jgi:hypothetical protein